MQELIEINVNTIGTEAVNSVNAREIHSYLGVKTKFSMWIDRAIKKYDFIKGEDYVVIITDPKSGKRDFIVTMDMAKELSMLENNTKGKETRKYFLKMEEKVKSQLQTPTPPTDINLVLLDMLKNQQRQTDALLDLTASVVKLVENKTVVPKMNVVQLEGSRKLDSVEKYTLRNAVQIIAVKLSKRHGVSKSSIIPGIWVKLKEHFEVFDYSDLKSEQLMVIGGWLDEYDIVDHSKGFIVAEGAIPMKEES